MNREGIHTLAPDSRRLGALRGRDVIVTVRVETDDSARGGLVKVTVAGDRVRLSGQALAVLRGELLA